MVWRRCIALFSAAALLFLAGCGAAQPSQQDDLPDDLPRRLLFVTDDIDAPFAAQAWQLLQQAAGRAGAQVTLVEVQYQADKAGATLNQASDGLYDVVILDRLGAEMDTQWLSRNAGYYPEVYYLCLDAAPGTDIAFDNVGYLVWDDLAAYYLYGALGAMASRSGTLGFFGTASGARSEWRFLAFYAGAVSVRENVRALYYTLGGDTPSAEALAASLQTAQNEGADVLCSISAATAQQMCALLEQQAVADAGGQEPDIPAQAPIVLGGAAAAQEPLQQELLAWFAFDVEGVLEELFADAVSGQPPVGERAQQLSGGVLRLEWSRQLAAVLTEEQRAECRRLEQTLRAGRVRDLPDLGWTQEERQSRIQQAANTDAAMQAQEGP